MFKHTFNLFNKTEKKILIFFFFIAISLLVFLPTIFGRPFWDDWVFIFRNAYFYQQPVLSFFPGGAHSRSWPIFYACMKFFLWAFGENYIFYHLVSLILHGINGFLAWKILTQLKIKYAFWLSILYLVHPMQLLSVGWVIQFKTILSIFFFLLSLQFLISFYNREKYTWLFFSLIFFGLSLLSKSATVGFIFVAIFFFPQIKKKFSMTKIILITMPFLLIGTYAIIRTTWSFNFREVFPEFVSKLEPLRTESKAFPKIYDEHQGAERLVLTTKIFGRYLNYLIYPLNNPIFQKKIGVNFSAEEFFTIFLVLVIVFYVGKTIYQTNNQVLQASFLFFAISILPFCGFVWIPIFHYSNFVPYWMSVSALGLLPLLPLIFQRKIVYIIFALAFGAISHLQSYNLMSTDKIFLQSIQHSPEEIVYYVALTEQYLYGLECTKAEKTIEQLEKLSGGNESALKVKTTRCFQDRNQLQLQKQYDSK